MKTVFELLVDTLDEKDWEYTVKNGNLSVVLGNEEFFVNENEVEDVCGLIEYIQNW